MLALIDVSCAKKVLVLFNPVCCFVILDKKIEMKDGVPKEKTQCHKCMRFYFTADRKVCNLKLLSFISHTKGNILKFN